MRVTAMPTVTAVHEDVHEGARENEQIREIPEGVRQVLGPKKDAANDQEDDAHEKGARCPETSGWLSP
jgi:hypothetical protein